MKIKSILLSLIMMFFLCSIAMAESWQEVYPRVYVDMLSIKKEGDLVHFWAKYLNDGSFDKIWERNVSYSLNKSVINCSNNKAALINVINYDDYETVIDSLNLPDNFYSYKYEDIPQGSKGEYVANFLCRGMNTTKDSQIVIFNPQSGKYHKPDCIHAKNCTKCLELPENEAKNRWNAVPCSKCFR